MPVRIVAMISATPNSLNSRTELKTPRRQRRQKETITAIIVPVCSITSRSVISGAAGFMPISFSATITCAELETGSSSARPCTMARRITCKRVILDLSRLRGLTGSEAFGHTECVATARIIVFSHSAFTVAVLLPERNCRGIIGCCFQSDLADSCLDQPAFRLDEEHRTDAMAAVLGKHVHGNDVAPWPFMRGDAKADHGRRCPFRGFGYDTICAGKPEILPQFRPRIGDARVVASLVYPVNIVEICRRI